MTTTTLFNHYYYAFPQFKEHLEAGNKIIMPASAVAQLTSRLRKGVSPMLFHITSSHRRSHCGVLEFTANEGHVLLPRRMMKNMEILEGDLVNIGNVTLPKGTYIKIQPHDTKFINLSNPRALLEVAFRDFMCLTTGDTIEINHANHKYLIDVLETKPSGAVSMYNTDCEVDFAQPLDYKEPEKKTSVLGKRERTTLGDEDRKSRAAHDEKSKLFPGEGRLLGGKTTVPAGLMKKLKITEVATTKKLDGSLKSRQGAAEFKPFSGKAKRLDGEPLVAVAVKDVDHDQTNACAKVKEEKHQGFKAFTGKSFRAM